MNRFIKSILTLILPLMAAAANAATIGGTFIQPHLFARWDDARWQQEFDDLRAAGMDKIIFMHTVNTNKLGEAFAVFHTEIDGVTPSETDLLEICLRNAAQADFKVFVGLNFDDRWWDFSCWTPEWIMQQMELGNRLIQELAEKYLSRYPGTFAGWYWVWEVEDSFCFMPGMTDYLVGALNTNLDCIARFTPGLPIILSPFMSAERSTPEHCAKMWGEVLAKAHFKDGDIFAPQDCIGSGFLSLDHVADWYKALDEVIPTEPKIKFWANIEDFDQRFWTTAPIGRIAAQIDSVAPYVDDLITFAYSHYYSPQRITPDLHAAYCQFVASGSLPECPTPSPVTDARIVNGVLLWNHQPQASLMGYHIYIGEKLVNDLQVRADGSCQAEWALPADLTEPVAIAAYNVIGIESPIVIL